MFYSHTYLDSITSLLDKAGWTNGQLYSYSLLASTNTTDECSKQLVLPCLREGGGGGGGGGLGAGKQKGADNKQRTCTPKVMKSIPKLSVSLYGPLTVLQNVSERFTFTG